jgi:hypothetical protein
MNYYVAWLGYINKGLADISFSREILATCFDQPPPVVLIKDKVSAVICRS